MKIINPRCFSAGSLYGKPDQNEFLGSQFSPDVIKLVSGGNGCTETFLVHNPCEILPKPKEVNESRGPSLSPRSLREASSSSAIFWARNKERKCADEGRVDLPVILVSSGPNGSTEICIEVASTTDTEESFTTTGSYQSSGVVSASSNRSSTSTSSKPAVSEERIAQQVRSRHRSRRHHRGRRGPRRF